MPQHDLGWQRTRFGYAAEAETPTPDPRPDMAAVSNALELGFFSNLLEHVKAALPLNALVIDMDSILKPGDQAHEIDGSDPLLARAVERLESFRQLAPNWNGYNGVVPTHEAIDDCLLFARSLPRLARGPVAMLSGQGEVGLLWERDSDEALVEVGFRGDGFYGYLAVMPDGASAEHEDIPVVGDLPPDLASALSVFLRG